MKISTRSKYASLIVFELSLNYVDNNNSPLILKDISKKYKISEKYLSKLALNLKGAGIIDSVRGINGGYVLLKEPKYITLKEIIEIMEGTTKLVDIQSTENTIIPLKEMWENLNTHVLNFLEKVNFMDIIDEFKKTLGYESFTYYI